MMRKTIWKFDIPIDVMTASFTTVKRIPKGSRLLHVREQRNSVCMWFEVDPEAELEAHHFQLHATGNDVHPGLSYLGTCIFAEGNLVIHLYEVVAKGLM